MTAHPVFFPVASEAEDLKVFQSRIEPVRAVAEVMGVKIFPGLAAFAPAAYGQLFSLREGLPEVLGEEDRVEFRRRQPCASQERHELPIALKSGKRKGCGGGKGAVPQTPLRRECGTAIGPDFQRRRTGGARSDMTATSFQTFHRYDPGVK